MPPGAELRSIGIDSWAVDYGLLRDGRLLGEPFHYRDERTAAGVDAVHAVVPPEELYRRNGLQFLPFNTLLPARRRPTAASRRAPTSLLLIPDLFAFWLTGRAVAERTNASTTGLRRRPHRRVGHRRCSTASACRRDSSRRSSTRHARSAACCAEVPGGSAASRRSCTVGSHDTASAVVAVPMRPATTRPTSRAAPGALVGVELERPVLTEASRAANFTNEGGVDGRVRFLHNVMGLWLLSESVRTWEATASAIDLPTLLAQARRP